MGKRIATGVFASVAIAVTVGAPVAAWAAQDNRIPASGTMSVSTSWVQPDGYLRTDTTTGTDSGAPCYGETFNALVSQGLPSGGVSFDFSIDGTMGSGGFTPHNVTSYTRTNLSTNVCKGTKFYYWIKGISNSSSNFYGWLHY